MTVSTTNTQNVLTGDGATTAFSFTFELLTASDLQVWVAGAQMLVGYTVAIGANNIGGTVTFGVAPPNLAQIVLMRVMPLTQLVTLPPEAPLPTTTLETMVDRLVLILQQLKTNIGLGLQLAATSVGVSSILPANIAGALFGWNAANNALTNINPVAAGYALIDNGPGLPPSFQPITTAAGGNVVGPAANTNHGIPLWNGANSKTLKDGIVPVQAGYFLKDNGPGVDPSFQSGAGVSYHTLGTGGSFALGASYTTIASIPNVPAGTYFVSFAAEITTTVTAQLLDCLIQGTTTLQWTQTPQTVVGLLAWSVCGFITLSTPMTINAQLKTNMSGAGSASVNGSGAMLVLIGIN